MEWPNARVKRSGMQTWHRTKPISRPDPRCKRKVGLAKEKEKEKALRNAKMNYEIYTAQAEERQRDMTSIQYNLNQILDAEMDCSEETVAILSNRLLGAPLALSWMTPAAKKQIQELMEIIGCSGGLHKRDLPLVAIVLAAHDDTPVQERPAKPTPSIHVGKPGDKRDDELMQAFALETQALSLLLHAEKQAVALELELDEVVASNSQWVSQNRLEIVGPIVDIKVIADFMGYAIDNQQKREIAQRASRMLIDVLRPRVGYAYEHVAEFGQFYQRDVLLVCLAVDEWASAEDIPCDPHAQRLCVNPPPADLAKKLQMLQAAHTHAGTSVQ